MKFSYYMDPGHGWLKVPMGIRAMGSIIDHSRCRRCNKPIPRLVLRNGLCKGCRRELGLPVLEDTHGRNSSDDSSPEGQVRLRTAGSG